MAEENEEEEDEDEGEDEGGREGGHPFPSVSQTCPRRFLSDVKVKREEVNEGKGEGEGVKKEKKLTQTVELLAKKDAHEGGREWWRGVRREGWMEGGREAISHCGS